MNSPTQSQGVPDSAEPIRVLFVETADATVRVAKPIFEGEFGIDVTVAARTDDVGRLLEGVDCVVHQLRPSTSTELDALRAVRESSPDLPYVVFSEVRTNALVGDALADGATDYLRVDEDDAGYWLLAARVATAIASRHGDGRERVKAPYGDVLDGTSLLDESLTFVAVSASYAGIHGYEPEQLVGESWTTVFPREAAESVEDVARRVRSRGSAVEELPARRRDRSVFSALVSLARGTGEQYICTVFDRSDRLDTIAAVDGDSTIGLERAFGRLEALLTARVADETLTVQDLCEAVVETIEGGNESAIVGIYLYDETIDALRRRAVTERFADSAPTVPFDDDEPTVLWNAFVEREPVLVAGLHPQPDDPVQDPGAARGLVVPIGTRGVLVVGTYDGPRPTPLDHAFVRLVGATTGTILDQVAARRRLDASERRLEGANLASERLEATIELVRRIARVIGRTWTRTELEQRVCEQVVSNERYAFARIAEFDEIGEELRDRAGAGAEKRYLESLETNVTALVEQGEPMASAIETLESRVSRHLLKEPADEQWRQEAVTRGFRSVVGVPLVFRERTYGGLVVYSDRPAAFDDTERELFEELGRWIAHAMHAIEARTALVGRGGVELTFRVRDREIQFLEWARETGSTVEFETVVSQPDGSIRGFFTVEGDAVEPILELAGRSPSVTETRLVTTRGDKHLFECTFTEDSVVAHLLEYGVVPKAISAAEAAGRLVVSLPEHTTVREFVEFFTRLYPESTLVRRRDHEFVARPAYGFRSELEHALTAKQLEALETAFVSGYFEIPRDATGEAIAGGLGITQPTFNNHLRVAQRKLLAMVFDDDQSPARDE